jgi:Protein of unknown function (DUF2892).
LYFCILRRNQKIISYEKNVGNADKSIRVLIAVIIAALYYFNVISGTLAYVLMAAAIILLITSLINFCPLYKLLGINTCKIK